MSLGNKYCSTRYFVLGAFWSATIAALAVDCFDARRYNLITLGLLAGITASLAFICGIFSVKAKCCCIGNLHMDDNEICIPVCEVFSQVCAWM